MKERDLAKFIVFSKKKRTLFRRSFYDSRAMYYRWGVPMETDASISDRRGVSMMRSESLIVSTLGDN